jgi:hypothetical protein
LKLRLQLLFSLLLLLLLLLQGLLLEQLPWALPAVEVLLLPLPLLLLN